MAAALAGAAARALTWAGQGVVGWLGPAAPPAVAFGPASALGAGMPLPTPLILGYYDGGGVGSAGYRDLVRLTGTLSGIVPDWYEIWSQGQITGSPDPGVLAYARAHGMWVFALVQQNQDPAVFHVLLTHPAYRARAVGNLVRLVESGGYDGLNLDFEGVRASDRAAFTRFVRTLAAALHARGDYLTLSVPAETADEPANPWTGAYDYRALGRAADLLLVMAYDDHWAGGPPGGVAPTPWVEAVVRYAVRAVGPGKVVLGVPAYGYDWGGAAPAQPLSYAQAVALDDAYARGRAGAHFAYVSGGTVHEVYFEDLATFRAKAGLAVAYDLRGIALWRLGIEDPAIWRLVRP